MLLEDFHPWLLVFGASGRDLNVASEAPNVEDVPWLRYRRGAYDVEGWLVDHSRAFRYFLTYRRWLDARQRFSLARQPKLQPNGFVPVQPIAMAREEQLRVATKVLSPQLEGGLAQAEIDRFVDLLRLRQRGLQVAVVEMPMHPTLYAWVERNAGYYADVLRTMESRTREQGAPFWRAPHDLPENGWADLWHLDSIGAPIFSRWLGERVGEAVVAGTLVAPAKSRSRS